MVFIAKNKVRMHDTDMAGRLYFARQFRFVHDALEDLVESEGLDFHKVFHEEKFVFVIVHCEADFFAQLKVGDLLDVHIACEHTGQTSFILFFEIFRNKQELVGTAKTVHVSLDASTGVKIPLPEKLRTILEKYKRVKAKEDIMAKGLEQKKDAKKKPVATLKEKRAKKKEKKTK